LKAKFRAWVGKYLMTFARLPLQREPKPCSLMTLEKQSPIPLYLSSTLMVDEASYTWRRSLTLSMGATRVLETAAETPPIMKSAMKLFFLGGEDICIYCLGSLIDLYFNYKTISSNLF